MIEIYALYKMCGYLGRILRAKGRSPLGFQALLVFLWFLFEFAGGLATQVLYLVVEGPQDSVTPAAYIGALVGAACGAAIVFVIVRSLPDRTAARAFPVEVAEAIPAQRVL